MGEKYYMTGRNTCTGEYQLMKNVYETSFALDDLGLYINTHPCDKEAKAAYTAMKLAEIKGLSYGQVCALTTENAKRIYRLKK